MKITWILNGQGIDHTSTSGAPIRFQAISSRWQRMHPDTIQTLITTPGGCSITTAAGCQLAAVVLPAALFLKREPFKAFRMWSYILTTLASFWRCRHMPAADVYITVSDYFCDVVPAILLKKRDCKSRWIAWIHHRELHPSVRPGNWVVNSVAWWIQEWSFKKISQFADQAWVLDSAAGDLVARRLKQLGMANDRIVKMKNGVDAASLRSIPEQLKEFDAVMIGVRPNKGLHDIVPIWRKVQEIRPGTTLLLIGGMTGVGSLKKEINSAGIDECIHIERPESGFVPFDEFFSKVKRCRVLFAPSHEEGWGIAHCEAMVCGLPVVAYDLPVYERVFGNSLLTVKESDHKAFAKAICSVLDDKALFNQYQDRGSKIAGAYDWDRISEDDWQHVL